MIKHFSSEFKKKPANAGFFNSNIWYFIILLFLILIPIYFIVLPADYYVGKKSFCLSVLLLDQNCYACGMTKALKCISNLDFKGAYQYNILSFIVFPIIIFYWIQIFSDTLKKLK